MLLELEKNRVAEFDPLDILNGSDEDNKQT